MFGYTARMIFLTDRKIADERVKSLLIEHAIRPTNQRMQIAGELLSKPQHLSADQVMARVNKKETLVSKATVYNTLNLFAEKGLIRQVIIDSGKVFYDSNTDSHYHIYNEDTGQLHDVEASRMTLEKPPELPAYTVKTGIDIIIRVKNSR